MGGTGAQRAAQRGTEGAWVSVLGVLGLFL